MRWRWRKIGLRMHSRARSGHGVGRDGEAGMTIRSAPISGDGGRRHDRGSASIHTGIGTVLDATNGRGRESEGTDIDTDNEMSDRGLGRATEKWIGRGVETDEGGRTSGRRAGGATMRLLGIRTAFHGGERSVVGADHGLHTKTGEGGAMIDDGMRVAC